MINKILRIKSLYLMCCFLFFSMAVSAQQRLLTLKQKDVSINTVLKEIEKQTAMSIVYNANDINVDKLVSINVDRKSLDYAMNQLFKNTGITYAVVDQHIILSQKNKKSDNQEKSTIKAKGKVTDDKNEALIGVSVVVKGATTGTITDMDGNFELAVPAGSVLEFSYIGYSPKSVTVNSDKPIVITLSEDSEMMDEVVVTALGIKRETKALSYNVQEVKSDALTTIKDANFVNSLSGKVAGVNIQRSASGVGGGTRVVIRGNKSVNSESNNNVLYVVDGIPIGNQGDRSGDGTGFGAGRTSGEGIASFNPEDIESVSVLTGPSAAALYGANAANGVVLITTKQGVEGKARITVSSSTEFVKPFVTPKFQNRFGNESGQYTSWGAPTDFRYNPLDFYKTGATFNNSFSLSTGTEKNQTYISGSAVNSKGIVENNKYHRYNATLRNTAKLFNNKLTLDFTANYIREYYNNMISYGTYFNPIVGTYLYPRGENFDQEKYFERYNPELGYNAQYWSPGDLGMNIQNPYWIVNRNMRPEVKDRYMLSALAKYNITEDLNISGRVRSDNTFTEKEDKRYASTIGTFAKPNGRYAYSNEKFKQIYADFIMNYSKSFAEIYNARVNAGASYEEYDARGQGYGGDLSLVPNKFIFDNIDPNSAKPAQSGGNAHTKNVGIFASAEMSWKSTVYLTVTGRADKPSQLINSKKEWTFYPSVGVSGIVTEMLPESLKQDLKSTLGFMKVRASYTEVGSPIPPGLTPCTVTHSMTGGTVQPFKYYPLADLSPERTRSYEFGLDSRWLNDNLIFGVTYYKSNTYDQLLRADLPKASGYDFMYVQAGNVQNTGWEFTLGYDDKFGDLALTSSFTATTNKNKIIELASNVTNPFDNEKLDLRDIKLGRFRLREGGEVGAVYADQWLSRDQDGYIKYTPGQDITNESTEPYKLGTVNPKWNLAWSNGLSYKGFRLNFLINARIGGIVISKTQAMLDQFGVSQTSAEARDRGYVAVGNVQVDPQTYFRSVVDLDAYNVYSATNVRLQEVSLAYTFPNRWFNGAVNNVTLTAYGTNLWMIYNKAPYDPELTASTGTYGQGYDYFMLPSQSTYGFSLKFGF